MKRSDPLLSTCEGEEGANLVEIDAATYMCLEVVDLAQTFSPVFSSSNLL